MELPRAHRRLIALTLACALSLACVVASTMPSRAASANAVVGVTVASATSIDASGCASAVAGKTEFGTVLPGSSTLTTIDCAVAFGSSNDTAMLRVFQTDTRGSALWRRTDGSFDSTFDGPSGTGNGDIELYHTLIPTPL